VVENVGGGGGSIGAAMVAHARPDGHTLLLGGTITHVNEALLKEKPLYDPAKDLDPIAAVAANVLAIAVHPSVPARSLEELVEYARGHSHELSYAHAGIGSIQHLAGELFKSLIDAPSIAAVPYRGTGPAVTDLIGGRFRWRCRASRTRCSISTAPGSCASWRSRARSASPPLRTCPRQPNRVFRA
jgi:tripartite-type tricarboxylate transporter receptor subunit TctC